MNQYNIKITSILDEESKNIVVTKCISVSSVIQIPKSIILEQKQYNVVLISSNITPLQCMYDNIKDSLCICTSTIDEKRITEIRNEIEELGAFALLSKGNPIDMRSSLPVFFITNDVFVPDIPYFSATRIHATIGLLQIDTLSNNNMDVNKRYGNYMCFDHSRNYPYKSYMEAYNETLNSIKSYDTNSSNNLITNVERYLSCKERCNYQHNMGTFVALALVCIENNEVQHEREVINITLNFLKDMEFKLEYGFQRKIFLDFLRTKGKTMNDLPINILYQFLMSNVKVWGAIDNDPQIKARCLYLLHRCGLLTRSCNNDWDLLWDTIDPDLFHIKNFFVEIYDGQEVSQVLHIFFQEDYHSIIDALLVQGTPLTIENVKRALLNSKKINTVQKYVHVLDNQLIPDQLKDTLCTMLRSEMKGPSTICQKLLLLDYYYSTKCTGPGSSGSTFDEQLFISDLIPDLIASESPEFVGLKECFVTASVNKNMFVRSSYKKADPNDDNRRNSQIINEEVYMIIARTLIRNAIHVVYNKPDVLYNLPIPNDNSPAFFIALIDTIKLELQNHFHSMSDTRSLLFKVVLDTPISDSTADGTSTCCTLLARHIAADLFCYALKT